MSVTLTGTGGYFTRQGVLARAWVDNDTQRGIETDALVTGIVAQYLSNEQPVIAPIWGDLDDYRSSASGWLTALQGYMQDTTIDQVDRDANLVNPTLANTLNELIRQMRAATQSIQRPTVTTSVSTGGSNVGDAVFAVSTTGPNGLPLDMVWSESITATVTADGFTGATAYAEQVLVSGDPSRSILDPYWPGGSGVSTGVSITNAAASTQVTDGNFENWTGNTPDDWTVVAGTPGTTIVKGVAPLRDSFCLRNASTGAVVTVKQEVTLQAQTVYAFSVWAKASSLSGTPTLVVKLVDGSGTTVNNDQATAQISTQTLTSAGSWVNYRGFFQTPSNLPAQVFLSVGTGTAVANAQTLDIDLIALVQPTLFYQGGPYIAGFSGGTPSINNDTWTLTVTNGAATATFVRQLDRAFDLKGLGIAFPSASSPTISDGLI